MYDTYPLNHASILLSYISCTHISILRNQNDKFLSCWNPSIISKYPSGKLDNSRSIWLSYFVFKYLTHKNKQPRITEFIPVHLLKALQLHWDLSISLHLRNLWAIGEEHFLTEAYISMSAAQSTTACAPCVRL